MVGQGFLLLLLWELDEGLPSSSMFSSANVYSYAIFGDTVGWQASFPVHGMLLAE